MPVLASYAAVWMLLSCGIQAHGQEVDWFVAPGGNDRWSGKLAEPNANKSDGPLATLDAARIKVREKLSSGSKSPINVLIRGGEHALSETIVFGIEDSGSEQFPITYRAFPGEQPVFTGGKKLTDWQKVTSDPKGISAKAKGQLWYIDLPSELKKFMTTGGHCPRFGDYADFVVLVIITPASS